MATLGYGQEFQYIQSILKEFYAPAIVNQVYKKAPFWAQIQKLAKGITGKRVYIPLQTAFTEAVGSRTANDYQLPQAQKNTYTEAYVYMKRNYGRIQVDGFAIEAAKGKGGWIDIVTGETKGVSSAFAIEIDRQSLGKGNSTLGLVSSVATPAITVKDPHEVTGDTPAAKWFRVGQVLDIHEKWATGSHTEQMADNTISSISGAVLTMASAVSGPAADDMITRKDSFGTGVAANQGDMMGLDGIISATNYPSAYGGATAFQGVASTSDGTWDAWVNSVSQVLSEEVIQVGLDSIEKRTDMESPNLVLTTYNLRNKLINIMQGDRMITTMDMKAGWKAIKYIGGNVSLPIMVHKNLPEQHWYYISLPHIKFYTLKKLIWDSKGGGVIKPVAGYDIYEAWFKMYGNIGTDCRNAHGKYTALTTS